MIITVNIPLTNELIRGVRDTHLKYTEDLLNKEERIASGEQEEEKINENFMTFNQRKTLLENTITEMIRQ